MKKRDKTVQNLKIEEAIKKTQFEGITEFKNLGIWTRITEVNFNKRIQKMEVKFSGIEGTVE